MAATVANSRIVGIILAVLSDLFLGRTDNIDIRFAAAIALLFDVLMVVVAIIAIALTVPRDDPGVGR
jgi:DHA2 family multidrug resistance protein-like MFS transporter